MTRANWFAAIRQGQTYFSTGPLVTRFEVEGRGPGEDIFVSADASPSVRVVADVVSIAPVDSLEVLVNGDVVQTVRATDPLRVSFEGRVDMPLGGWIALRVSGPKSRSWATTTRSRKPRPCMSSGRASAI